MTEVLSHNGYHLSPVEPTEEQLSAISALLSRVFPGSDRYSIELLDWQYRQNPVGKVVGYNAFWGDELAAHYVTLPIEAQVHGQHQRGLLSLNTATDAAHRGRNLFVKLAQQTYARGAATGHQFVVGVANANSTPGFVRRLGFQLVSPLHALVQWREARPRRDDLLWEYASQWSREALRWRVSDPTRRYALRRRRDEGCSIYSAGGPFGMPVQLGAFPAPLAAPDLPSWQAWWPISLYLGLGMRHNRDPVAFSLPIPMTMRPSPLNMIFLDLTDEGRRLNPHRTWFNAMDFDAF